MTTARGLIVSLLNEDVLRTPRKMFGMYAQLSLTVIDVTPERIVIANPTTRELDHTREQLALNMRNAILNHTRGALPVERFVMAEIELPFEEPGPTPSAVITLDVIQRRFRRAWVPRMERLWARAECEGWAEGPDDRRPRQARIEAAWERHPLVPTVSPTDHPHDRLLAALNAASEEKRTRHRLVRFSEGKEGVIDVDPDRIVIEAFDRSISGGTWERWLRAIEGVTTTLFPVITVGGVALLMYDRVLEDWMTFDEHWEEPRGGIDGVPPATRRRIHELWDACAAIGWERGTLARTTPAQAV